MFVPCRGFDVPLIWILGSSHSCDALTSPELEEKQLCHSSRNLPSCHMREIKSKGGNLSVFNSGHINNFYVSIKILFVCFNLISYSESKHFHGICQN